MNEAIKKKLEAIQARADKAALEWLNVAEQDVEGQVRRMLDQRLQSIVIKLMGFDNRGYGRDDWELDHCNGRSGESAAGDWLRERARAAAKEWLTEQAGALPELPKKAIASLRSDYTRRLVDEVNSLMSQAAVEEARKALALLREGSNPKGGDAPAAPGEA